MHGSGEAQSLSDLARRARQGDEAAFLALYERLARTLYGTALRMLHSREEAEDVVQEAFLAFHRHGADGPDSPEAWLRRVTINGCIDRIRRRRRRRAEETLDPAHDGAAGGAAPAVLRLDLERAVARLPERARLVFLLHDVEGLGHAELAAVLGISTGASKSQLFRAREILRGFLRGPAEARP